MTVPNLIIEGIWIVIAIAGMLVTYFGLQRAKNDRDAARQWTNGRAHVRVALTSGALFRNRVRMVLFGWWLLIGLAAVGSKVLVAVDFFEAPIDVPRVWGLFGLIGTAIGHVFIVLHESHENNVLDEMLAHGGDHVLETDDQLEDRKFGEHRREIRPYLRDKPPGESEERK